MRGLSDEERTRIRADVLALDPLTDEQVDRLGEIIANARATWADAELVLAA